jgi:PAS domain S-box-containing protein
MLNEERYQRMIEQIEDYAILMMDERGIIQNWNKGAEKIKGYKAEEIIGKSFQVFYLKEDQQRQLPQQLMREARQNGKAIHEGWRVRKDGSTFWGSIVVTALHDENNQLMGFTKVTRDLTERMLADEKLKKHADELAQKNKELQQQKEFIETVIDSSVDVIAVLNKDLKYIMINKRSEELYGQDILGKHILECFPVIKETSMYENILRALKGEMVHDPNHKSEILKKYFENFYIPIKNARGEVDEILLIGHDISDIIEANQKLERAIEELKKNNQELEQFAYVSSHDLQEPLRKIQTFSDLITKNLEQPSFDIKRYLGKIHASANRMSVLINDLLNFSRLSKTEDYFASVDLNDILENVKNDFEALIDQKKAVIQSGPLPVIRGIPIQLNQLFFNLVSNALKFCEKDPVILISSKEIDGSQVHNSFPHLDATQQYAHISFKDNGIGFDHMYATQIFTIFQQLNDRQQYHGTGIGLAICKKIAENHRGVITATGELNKGATFDMYLPITVK